MTEASQQELFNELQLRIQQRQYRRKKKMDEAKQALIRLIQVARGGSHQPHHVRRFLLGLYNSSVWPFELNRLRNLDAQIQRDCMAVLELDFMAGNEVHTYTVNGDDIWREFWEMEKPEADND